MESVRALVDEGIRAYVAGKIPEARRLLDEALRRDPRNARARSYLLLFQGGEVAAPAPAPVGGAADPAGYAPSPWDDGPAAVATVVLEAEEGLDLSAVAEKSDLRPLVPEATQPSAPGPGDVDVWMAGARDLHALGDFSGSLEMIEKILKVDAEHHEAREYLRQNEATLVAMYESKLGPLACVPRLAIQPEEVMWLNLDHRAGFLLAQIDGTVDFESLFALSGLPRLDAARILATFVDRGVIAS